MLRSIVAVLSGYLLFAASAVALFWLSGRDPHAPASALFQLFTTLYGMLFAGLGGFVAAVLARRSEFEHGFAVATLIAVIGAASLLGTLGHGSLWTQLAAILIMAPMAMVGARFRARQVRRSRVPAAPGHVGSR